MAPIDSTASKINYNRITGIASGLDVDSIIDNLMKAERMPLDKLFQKKQTAEWRKQLYREINSKILDLRTSYFDNTRLSTNLKAMAPFKRFTALSTDTTKVTITTTNDATPGRHTVSVAQLAESARTESSTASLVRTAASDFSGYDSANNTLTIALNGVSYDITLTDQANMDDLTNHIQSQINANSDLKGKVNVFKSDGGEMVIKAEHGVIELTGSALSTGKIGIVEGTTIFGDINNIKIQDLKGLQGNDTDFIYSSDYIIFSVNGKEITVSKDKTAGELVRAVNSSDAGVTMTYNSFTGKFDMISKTTGSSANIMLEDKEGTDFLAKSGLIANAISGKDARYTIDGVEGISSSNGFTVDGIFYTLKDVTTTDVTVSATSDIESVVSTIKGFVDKYNEMIDFVNKKLKEERYRDFLPLTDAQKKEMKDKDIEKWEEKAKSGLIRDDMLVSNFRSDIRAAVSGKVDDNFYEVLSSIGITTGDYSEGGKLHLSEETLREKLSENPERVMELFNKKVENSDGSINYAQSGIAYKIDEVFTRYISTSYGAYGLLIQKAGTDTVNTVQNQIQTEIKTYDKDMLDMSIRLDEIQERYYRKFTALEVALSRMNSQSQWLMNQLGASGQQ